MKGQQHSSVSLTHFDGAGCGEVGKGYFPSAVLSGGEVSSKEAIEKALALIFFCVVIKEM